MSAYSGPQQKGAAAARRKSKRADALTREARYEHRVLRYAIQHGVGEVEARKQLRLMSSLAHRILAGVVR